MKWVILIFLLVAVFILPMSIGQVTPSSAIQSAAAYQSLSDKQLSEVTAFFMAGQVASSVALNAASNYQTLSDRDLRIIQTYSVAQLSPQGLTIPIISIGSASPAASTTYYFGMDSISSLETTYALASVKIPKTGTVRGAYIKVRITTPGSGETVSSFLRFNDSTDVALPNSTWNASSVDITTTTLNQAVNAGDTFVFKVTTPAWVSAPATLRVLGYLYVE